MHFLVRFIINAIVLYFILNYVPGFTNGEGVQHFGIMAALIVAIIFGIVNALIGPILRMLGSPITWLTHGAFSVIINWALFGLTVWIDPAVKGDWKPTLIGAVIMMIISTLLQQLWKSDSERTIAA